MVLAALLGLTVMSAQDGRSVVLDVLRAARRAGRAEATLPSGTLRLSGTITIGPEFDGIRLVGSGTGTTLDASSPVAGWLPLRDPEVLHRLPTSARGRIVEAPLPDGARGDDIPDLLDAGVPQSLATLPKGWLLIEADTSAGRREIPYRSEAVDALPDSASRDGLRAQGWSEQFSYFDLPVTSIGNGAATVGRANFYQFRPHHRVRFANAIEGLDAPGEYVVDLWRRRILWWPKAGTMSASLPGNSPILKITAADSGASGMRMQGTSSDAVQVSSAERVRLESLNVVGVGQAGIRFLDDKSNGAVLRNCTFDRTGSGGLVLLGGDRAELRPSGTVVSDCRFVGTSRLQRGEPAVRFAGCGHKLLSCDFENMPGQAVVAQVRYDLGDPSKSGANLCRIVSCNFRRVCREATDAGAVYAGRDWTNFGNEIEDCLFDSIRSDWNPGVKGLSAGVRGVMLDDRLSGWTVRGCTFRNVETGVHIVAGWGNRVLNCRFEGCDRAIHLTTVLGGKTEVAPNEILSRRLAELPVTGSTWRKTFPQLARRAESTGRSALDAVSNSTEISGNRWSNSGWYDYSSLRVRTGAAATLSNNRPLTNRG